MTNAIFQDEFHAEMRRRMKDIYYNHGGKERSAIRKYLRRFGLKKEVLEPFQTDEEKLIFLREYGRGNRANAPPL